MGKLSVPDEILNKPGALTDEEYEIVKRHSEWGEELLAQLGFPGDVRRLVRDHHERLDGSGYPFGAFGDQLDLETRIIGTCDVYDALISPRVLMMRMNSSRRQASTYSWLLMSRSDSTSSCEVAKP